MIWRRSLIVTCCLLAVGGVLHAARATPRPAARESLETLPRAIDGWQEQPSAPIDASAVAMLGADDLVNRVYWRPGLAPVALYVAYYASQREGDTIHSPLNCLPGAGWEPAGRTVATLDVPGRSPGTTRQVRVNRLIIRKGLDRELVLYWYQSHGRVTASEYWGRALLVFDALRTSRTDGALVRVIAPIASPTPEALAASERSATTFVQSIFPLLGRFLPD